jgi:hypothetical protein
MPATAGNTPPAAAPDTNRPPPVPKIDTGQIAEKVYRLMQRDLLVERDRTGGLRG